MKGEGGEEVEGMNMKSDKMLGLKAAFLKWCGHCHMLHSVPSFSPMTRVHPSHVHSAPSYHTQHQCTEGAQGSLKTIHPKQLPSYWLSELICLRWQLKCLSLLNITARVLRSVQYDNLSAYVCSTPQPEYLCLFNMTTWVLMSVQYHSLSAYVCSTWQLECSCLFSTTAWALTSVQHDNLSAYVCSIPQPECLCLFNMTTWMLCLFSVTTWVLMPVQHHSLVLMSVQYHSLTHQLQDCTPS